jgi:sialic acid synthase SpsE
MFKRCEFKSEDWIEIFKYCEKKRTIFFATAQNASDLDFLLANTDMPLIKVGSDDLTNLELLSYYASKQKPMIISAGMAYLSEIEDAVIAIREQKNNNIAVLHCVASYPADVEELNLRKMITIKNKFDVVAGFSDHSMCNTAAAAATALGASIIEKHFTLDKNLPGPDHWFSADVKGFAEMVSSVRYVERALGSEVLEPTQKELDMRKIARRSIVAAVNIPAGRQITEKDITFKKPGTGLAPKLKQLLLGKKTRISIQKDEQITLEKVF